MLRNSSLRFEWPRVYKLNLMDYKGCGGGNPAMVHTLRSGCGWMLPGQPWCIEKHTLQDLDDNYVKQGREPSTWHRKHGGHQWVLISTSYYINKCQARWPGQPSEPGGKGSTPVWINLPLPYHVLTMCGHRDSIPLRYDMPNADGFLTWSVSESPWTWAAVWWYKQVC